MSETLYRIDTGYAVFGIVVKDNYVIRTSSIAKWTLGKNINEVLKYYREKKKAKIQKLGANNGYNHNNP